MAHLILPSRFNRQPNSPVRLDENHPLFDNIVSAGTVFGGVPYDVKANGILTRAGTTGTTIRCGQQFATTGTGSGDVWSLSAGATLLPVQNAVSMLCRAYSNSYSTTRKRAIRFANPTNGTTVALDFGNGAVNQLIASVQVVGSVFPAVYGSTPVGVEFSDVLFTRLGTQMGLYVDGNNAFISTSDASSNNLVGVTNQVFVGNSSSTFPLNGGVSQWVLFNIELSAGWAKELYINPWQIFKKRPNILYFDVGGGGGTTLTKTSSADAVLQQTQVKTLSTSAVLTASAVIYTRASTANALLQKAFTKTLSANATLRQTLTRTTSSSAVLVGSLTTYTRTLGASAVLEVQHWDGDSESWDSDATLWDSVSGSVLTSASAALQKGFSISTSASAKLQKSYERFISYANAKLEKEFLKTTGASAVLQKAFQVTTGADAIITGSGTRSTSASALLQKVFVKTLTANALLSQVQSKTVDASALLQITPTLTSSGSAILQKFWEKHANASAVITSPTPSVLAYASALLQKNSLTAVSADAIISTTGWVEAAGVSNPWIQEGAVASPWTPENAASGSWT